MTVKNSWIQPEIRRLLAANGLFGIGQVHHAVAVGGNSQPFFEGKVPQGNLHYNIADAITNIESGRNDVIVVSPDNHSQGAGLTFAKDNSHILGMAPPARMNHRSRIGHNANFATLFTMTGTGNSMHNMYFMHGRGDDANKTCIAVSGNRNSFFNCHFGGPMHSTEAGEADYVVLNLTGSIEGYFKNCTIGVNTIARAAANKVLQLGAGSFRNIFEDCIFLCRSDDGASFFIDVASGLAEQYTIFKNCLFINTATALTEAVKINSADKAHMLFFDSMSNFFGVTKAVAANREETLAIASVPYTAGATQNLLNVVYDHTA